jgi:hypothetical protein
VVVLVGTLETRAKEEARNRFFFKKKKELDGLMGRISSIRAGGRAKGDAHDVAKRSSYRPIIISYS